MATRMATVTLRWKKGKVLLRVAHKGVKRYKTLPVNVSQKDWNAKTSSARRTHKDYQKINEYLSDILSQSESAMGEHIRGSEYYDAASIYEAIEDAVFTPTGTKQTSFIEFYKEIIQGHIAANRFARADTQSVIVRKLEHYAKSKNKKDIRFSDVTTTFIRRFDMFLSEEYGNAHNTRIKTLRGVRAVVNSAINEGHIKPGDYAFRGYPLQEVEGKKERLTEEEFRRIENLDLPEGSPIWHARNTFCLQVYTAGARIGDTCALEWNDVRGGRLRFRQGKTSGDQSMRLPESALRILGFYESRRQAGKKYILPYMEEYDLSTARLEKKARDKSRSRVGNLLPKIAEMAGIEIHITTHVARHSFADMARKANMPLYAISKALGHKSLKQTERYLASFDSDAVDDMLSSLF